MSYADAISEERAASRKLANLERARKAKVAKARERKRTKTMRLRVIDGRLRILSTEYAALPVYPEGRVRRSQIRREIRDLNAEHSDLEYGA